MKHTLKNQARLAGITCAAAAACVAFGTALADPTPTTPTFTSASISIEPRGEEAGGLNCSWREAGLGAFTVVTYKCDAAAVGVLEGCSYRNKIVSNITPELEVFTNVTGEGHDGVAFFSKNNGQIMGTTITAIPEGPHVPEGAELCPEPTVPEVIAVRWCNASLVDATNGITGATVGELFEEFFSGYASVPSCAEMLAAP